MKTHLTIIGDRQHGKTEALLHLAFGDAADGKSVYFTSENAPSRADAFRRGADFATKRTDIIKIVRSHGSERILFEGGGRIIFGLNVRGFDVDTHVIDSPVAEEHPGAQRIIRSARR